MEQWVFWLIAIIVLTILELSTVSLVSVWFIVSAIVSLLLSFIIKDFLIQFSVFSLLGLVLMITTRPILNKWLKPNDVKTNLDRVIGMEGIVTETITKNKIGEVKVDGKSWSAIAEEKILKEEIVIVEKIDGVKLIVRKGEK